MSKLRMGLLGLALGLGLVAAGPTAQPANACIEVITYAYNPATNECREFPNPCSVPRGWIKNYPGCPANN